MSLREQFDESRHHRLRLVIVREEEGLQRRVHAECDRLHNGRHPLLQPIVLHVQRLQCALRVLRQQLRQQRPHRGADPVVVHDEVAQLRTEARSQAFQQLHGDCRPHVVVRHIQRLQLRKQALRHCRHQLLRRLLPDALRCVGVSTHTYR